MKKTILMQLFMLFAFSTICMAQQKRPDGKIRNIEISTTGISMNNPVSCYTNHALGQPTNGIRTIEAVTQGYRDNFGRCLFDVELFIHEDLEEYLSDEIKWEIDGVRIPIDPDNPRTISVPVPAENTTVRVTYTIGNQSGAATRTF